MILEIYKMRFLIWYINKVSKQCDNRMRGSVNPATESLSSVIDLIEKDKARFTTYRGILWRSINGIIKVVRVYRELNKCEKLRSQHAQTLDNGYAAMDTINSILTGTKIALQKHN